MSVKKIIITVTEPAINLPTKLQGLPQAKLDMQGFNDIEALQVLSSVVAGIAAELAAKTNAIQMEIDRHNKKAN